MDFNLPGKDHLTARVRNLDLTGRPLRYSTRRLTIIELPGKIGAFATGLDDGREKWKRISTPKVALAPPFDLNDIAFRRRFPGRQVKIGQAVTAKFRGEDGLQGRLAESLQVKSAVSVPLRLSEKSGLAVDFEERRSTDSREQSPGQASRSHT